MAENDYRTRDDKEILDLNPIKIPTANVKRTTYLASAPAQYMGMAFGLFMLAAPMMEWIDYESPSLGAAYGLGGLCEYIMGFFDWYRGRTVQSFVDFVFGLLHFAVFLTAKLGLLGIPVPHEYYTYMQGTFYVIWFVMILFLIIASKDRGKMYLINFLFLALGALFTFIWEYSKYDWARKAGGYFIFFATIFIWLTGLFKALNGAVKSPLIPVVVPGL